MKGDRTQLHCPQNIQIYRKLKCSILLEWKDKEVQTGTNGERVPSRIRKFTAITHEILVVYITIITIIIMITLIIIMFLVTHSPFPSWHFSSTNGDPQRSRFKFPTAVLPVLRVTFHVQLSYSESVQYFPGMASKFFFKTFVTIPVAPGITGIIIHFMFHIRLYYYYYYFIIILCRVLHNYVPEKNNVSRVYSSTAIWYLQFILRVMFFSFFPCWMFNTLHQYFPKHARSVQYGCFLHAAQVFFWMILKYEVVPVAPLISGITSFLHSTCAVFLLWGLYISEPSRFLSCSRIIIIIIIIIILCF